MFHFCGCSAVPTAAKRGGIYTHPAGATACSSAQLVLAAKASDWQCPPTKQPGKVAEAASMPILLEDLESYHWFKGNLAGSHVVLYFFLQTGRVAENVMHWKLAITLKFTT